MKITGLELINKIYNNEIKEGTHINYYRDDYLDYEFYGELLFTNGAIWFTDNRPECDMEVKTSIILDNYCKFEILKEQKKIPEKIDIRKMLQTKKWKRDKKTWETINSIIDYLESKGDE